MPVVAAGRVGFVRFGEILRGAASRVAPGGRVDPPFWRYVRLTGGRAEPAVGGGRAAQAVHAEVPVFWGYVAEVFGKAGALSGSLAAVPAAPPAETSLEGPSAALP
jgi:hypothetical protein